MGCSPSIGNGQKQVIKSQKTTKVQQEEMNFEQNEIYNDNILNIRTNKSSQQIKNYKKNADEQYQKDQIKYNKQSTLQQIDYLKSQSFKTNSNSDVPTTNTVTVFQEENIENQQKTVIEEFDYIQSKQQQQKNYWELFENIDLEDPDNREYQLRIFKNIRIMEIVKETFYGDIDEDFYNKKYENLNQQAQKSNFSKKA